jgi:hypothetical protein
MTTHVSSGPDLFYETITRKKRARLSAGTGRDRLRAYGLQNGFTWIGGNPEPDVDEFIRGDRIVHVRYADDRVLDVLVNGRACSTGTAASPPTTERWRSTNARGSA